MLPDKRSLIISSHRSSTRAEEFKCGFNAAFGPDASQSDVYAAVAPSIALVAAKGISATVMAYGQTGSGKTHTMLGPTTNEVRLYVSLCVLVCMSVA